MVMKCYVTGGECTCGALDVMSDCPHDSPAPDDEVTSAIFDLDDTIAERQFAMLSERLDGGS